MPSDFNASTGITPPRVSPSYATYKSRFGPKYEVPVNFHGWTLKSATKLGATLAAFGGVAGFTALYFLSGVPRVSHDIFQKVPVIGEHFVKEIPPSDNPF